MVKHVTTYRKTGTSCLKRKYITRRSPHCSIINSKKNVKEKEIYKELENDTDPYGSKKTSNQIKQKYILRKSTPRSKCNLKNGRSIKNGRCKGLEDESIEDHSNTTTKTVNIVKRKYITRKSAPLTNGDSYCSTNIKTSENVAHNSISNPTTRTVNKIKREDWRRKSTPPKRCKKRNGSITSITSTARSKFKEIENGAINSAANATTRTVNKIKRKYVTRKSFPYSKRTWKDNCGYCNTNAQRDVYKELENNLDRRTINKTKGKYTKRKPSILRCNLRSSHVHSTTICKRDEVCRRSQTDSRHELISPITKVKSAIFKYIKCRTCRVPCDDNLVKKLSYNSGIKKIDVSPNLGVKMKKQVCQRGSILNGVSNPVRGESNISVSHESHDKFQDTTSYHEDRLQTRDFEHSTDSYSSSPICPNIGVTDTSFEEIKNTVCSSFSIRIVNEYRNFMSYKSTSTYVQDGDLKDAGRKDRYMNGAIDLIASNVNTNSNKFCLHKKVINEMLECTSCINDNDLQVNLNSRVVKMPPFSGDVSENVSNVLTTIIDYDEKDGNIECCSKEKLTSSYSYPCSYPGDSGYIHNKEDIENKTRQCNIGKALNEDLKHSYDENGNFMNNKFKSEQGLLGKLSVTADEIELNSDDICSLNVDTSKRFVGEEYCCHCENNDDYESCKCCVMSSRCFKYIDDDSREINTSENKSYYCKDHKLIHCRKHVRLKEIYVENSLHPLSSHVSSVLNNNENISHYIFESARRLELLHNRFFLSSNTPPPNENITKSMLENIGTDIELFKEDISYFTNKCEWDDCNEQFEDSNKLLDHLKNIHICPSSDNDVFTCLWRRCKFINQPSSSYKWLSKHVLRHCCDRPFKCVISGCESSFSTQNGLARHVPSHFNEGKVRRACVLTSTDKGRNHEDGTRNSIDLTLSSMDDGDDTDESSEPIRKRSRYEKFVDKYKTRQICVRDNQGVLNNLKCRLQISTCDSPGNCGFIGHYFRFSHKVVGKRTSTDGSIDMLLSPSSCKMFPLKSFWFDGRTLEREKSLFVDINVNNLSDDIKQQLYDNEHSFRLYKKGVRSNRY